MFRTAFKNLARNPTITRGYSTIRKTRNNTKVVVGVSLVASSLLLLPLTVVKNDTQPSTDNTKLAKKEGISGTDHITYGKRNQPNKAIDEKQPETKIIPVDTQTKKSEQPVPPKAKLKAATSGITQAKTETDQVAKPEVKTETEVKEEGEQDTKDTQKDAEKDTQKAENDSNEKAENDNEPEAEGSQSAAFNPETGEINWDCPCLGGMAHGPCGEEFKAAFSCFVYSETEPKGIDCIEKFEGMRTCFKKHPEHYKEELYEDDEPVPSTESASESVSASESKDEATVDIPKVA
ncbi:hypothetical protein PUMCH_001138 [Australozyma saopauloensis]|uniref:Mitochondrial intermembrane space import and assembly protein 40 n=1 Tax=Australozyma saopauloensis TaxID=291208 RepID=A0AAX4H5U0_9ASCO|nr:hypothetical protein PUMCH_001138 [[Candida] saopauloensis]